MWIVERLLEMLAIGAGVVVGGGIALALALRRYALDWTWAALGLPASSSCGRSTRCSAWPRSS
jgi:hypothetical protein